MRCLLLIFGFFMLTQAAGQDEVVVADRSISESTWEKAEQGLDYSDDVKKKEPEYEEEEGFEWNWGSAPDLTSLGTIVQVLVIGLALLGLAWALYHFLGQPSNRKLKQQEITIENLDEHLEESDLDRFLREALAGDRYADALRIQFLKIIKSLNEKGHIKWAKEKTNRNYLSELSGKPFLSEMRAQTRVYEKVWYGNMEVDKTLYLQLSPGFESLLSRI